MSELIQKNDNRATIRWKLLTGASALALTAYVSSASLARAEDASKPQIWIELDGQFSQQNNSVETYAPPFLIASPFDATSHVSLEKGAPKIWDTGAKITYQPEVSDWILSLGIRYGKTARDEIRNQLTAHASHLSYFSAYDAYQLFGAKNKESHTIVDFRAGRDLGIGAFGHDGNSIVGFGVRYAQFESNSNVSIRSVPTNANAYHPYNRFYASFVAARRFTGIGPSLSWNASAALAGNPADSEITLDWGVNAAVLFGRQKMIGHHQTTENHWRHFYESFGYQTSKSPARSKNVTVPNLGGFAGVSFRYSDAKISMGYRADMFFGAIDGGIDTAKKENRGFYGPFASISVGIGD